MIFKFEYRRLGIRVSAKLFSGINQNSLSDCGNLVFHNAEDWERFITIIARGAVSTGDTAYFKELDKNLVIDAVTLKVNGVRFICECGGNLFDQSTETTFACNSCGIEYTSDFQKVL